MIKSVYCTDRVKGCSILHACIALCLSYLALLLPEACASLAKKWLIPHHPSLIFLAASAVASLSPYGDDVRFCRASRHDIWPLPVPL